MSTGRPQELDPQSSVANWDAERLGSNLNKTAPPDLQENTGWQHKLFSCIAYILSIRQLGPHKPNLLQFKNLPISPEVFTISRKMPNSESIKLALVTSPYYGLTPRLYPAISEADINPKDLKNRPYYWGQRVPRRFSASWPERLNERPTLPQLILRSLSPNSAVPAAPCSKLIYSVDCLNLPLLNTTCHMSKTISQHGRSHILSCHTDPDRERVTTSMIPPWLSFPNTTRKLKPPH